MMGACVEVPPEGLSVLVGEDGVWLAFDAPGGYQALIHAEALAQVEAPIVEAAIRSWAAARQAAATRQGA